MHLQCNRFRFNLTKSTKYEEYIYIYITRKINCVMFDSVHVQSVMSLPLNVGNSIII